MANKLIKVMFLQRAIVPDKTNVYRESHHEPLIGEKDRPGVLLALAEVYE